MHLFDATVPMHPAGEPDLVKYPCEDAAASWQVGRTAYLAVADGIGECARSDEASHLAVWLVRSMAGDLATEDAFELRRERHRELFVDVQSAFRARCKRDPEPEQLLTTLSIVAVVAQTELHFASLGDSILAVHQRDEEDSELVLLSHLPRVGGGPAHLEGDLEVDGIRFVARPPGLDAVFLATDGLENHVVADPSERWSARLRPQCQKVLELVRLGDAMAARTTLSDMASFTNLAEDDIGIAVAAW